MNPFLPDSVWMFDDNIDAIGSVVGELTKRDPSWDNGTRFRGAVNEEELGAWVTDQSSGCDVALIDIVGHEDQLEWVERALSGELSMGKLCDLSGVRLLTLLRHVRPRLPVVMLSSYFTQSTGTAGRGSALLAQAEALRSLTRSAVCGLAKSESFLLPDILWIAQQAIIGVRVAEDLADAAGGVLAKVNAHQDHFFFVRCSEERT